MAPKTGVIYGIGGSVVVECRDFVDGVGFEVFGYGFGSGLLCLFVA